MKPKRTPEDYRRIGALGGAINRAMYGVSHLAEIGKKGGEKTKQRGSDYYREIARLSHETRRAKAAAK